MADSTSTEVRPAHRKDAPGLSEFLRAAPPAPGAPVGQDSVFVTDLRLRVVALRGGEIVGACYYVAGEGHCAAVTPPRMYDWDDALAARLCRAAAALAWQRHRARLIQCLTPPEPNPLALALERGGFAPLALLAYMRRPIRSEDRLPPPPTDLQWAHYSRLRHRRFARTLEMTYVESLDCPGLAGLRPVDDVIETHKHAGRFRPRTWRLALAEGLPLGVAMLNNLKGRGELVYLGVVPAARGRGVGRALLTQAIRDTAEMGLPQMGLTVDVGNPPALRLYQTAGFKEIRRRMSYFVPADRLELLSG